MAMKQRTESLILSRRHVLGATLALPLATITAGWVTQAAAQTPEAAGGTSALDLAAIPQRGADVPTGFYPNNDSAYEFPPLFLMFNSVDETAATRRYRQYYNNTEWSDTEFRGLGIAATEFASIEDAEAAIAFLKNADSILASNPQIVSVTPLEPLGLSEGGEYLGILATDERVDFPDGWVGANVVSAFRVGNLVLEVLAMHLEDPAAPENADFVAALLATPVAADESLIETARSVADVTSARASAVLAGEPLAGVNYALPAEVLPIPQTWPESAMVFEGYRDQHATFDGELNSFSDSLLSGYMYALTTSSTPDTFDPPYVSASITQMDSPETVANLMTAFESASDDLQTPGPTPRGVPRTFTTAPEIPGADAVLAYFSRLADEAVDDSAGIVFSMGDRFAQIEVQGIGPDESLAAASELALAQATCATGGSCAAPAVPAGLGG